MALVVFAPLFALLLKWREPGWSSVFGLTFLVLEVSLIAFWWALASLGALTGWALYRCALARARTTGA